MKKNWKRILAAFLAISIVFGNAAPTYATEAEPVVEVVEAETEVAEDMENTEIKEEIVLDSEEEAAEEVLEFEEETELFENETENIEESEPVESEEPVENTVVEKVTEEVTAAAVDSAAAYTGTVVSEEWGDCLYIRHWEVTNDGGTFDDAVILSALQSWDRIFHQVMICYPDGYSTEIPADIWNAVNKLDGDQDSSNGFLFDHGTKGSINWFVDDMQTANGSVSLDASLDVIGNDVLGKLTVEDTDQIPADGVHIRFCASSWKDDGGENKHSTYDDIISIFGTDLMQLELSRFGKAIESRSDRYEYYADEWDGGYNYNAEICFDGVDRLENGTYEVTQKTYKGQVEDWDGPALVIRHEHFDDYGLEFTTETILDVLKARAGERFQIVEINYPYRTGSIPAELWNAAVALLDPVENDEDFAHLRFNFYDEEGTDQNWNFDSPVAVDPEIVSEIDTGMKLTFVKEDDADADKVTGIRVKFDNTDYPVERGAYINFYTDNARYKVDETADWLNFINYFGTETCRVAVCAGNVQTDVSGEYRFNDDDEPIHIELNGIDVNALPSEGAGSAYHLEKAVYTGETGEWDDGTTILRIDANHFAAYGIEFDETVVADILADRNSAGEVYDRVELRYPTDITAISNKVWKAAVAILSDSENRAVSISDTDNSFEWTLDFNKPTAENMSDEGSQSFVFEWNVNEAEGFAEISFDSPKYMAEHVNWNCWADSSNENLNDIYQSLTAAFGMNTTNLSVTNFDDEETEDLGGHYHVDDREDGNSGISLNISDINRMEDSVSYKVSVRNYTGEIFDVENGQKCLFMNSWEAGKGEEGFTLSDVQEILSAHEGEKFQRIEFFLPDAETDVIKAEFIEAVKPYLAENNSGNCFVLFTFHNPDEECSFQVWVRNPGSEGAAVEQEDVIVNWAISVDSENKVVNANIDRMDFNADLVFAQYHGSKDSGLGKQFIECFGGKEESYYLFKDEAYENVEFVYGLNWDEFYCELLNYDNFDDQDSYEFAFKMVPYTGTKYEDEDGNYVLTIDTSVLDVYDTNVIAVLEANSGETFDRVEINYNNAPGTIQAAVWNGAAALLEEEGDLCINFAGEAYDVNWTFYKPAEEKGALDFSANLWIDDAHYARVNLAKTDFNAEHTGVHYCIDSNYESWEGYGPYLTGGEKTVLKSLDGYNVAVNAYANIDAWDDPECDYSNRNVHVNNVGALEAGHDYILYDYIGNVDEYEDGYRALFINHGLAGKEDSLTEEELNEILNCHAGKKYREIGIEQAKGEENVIYASVANKLYELLDTYEDEEGNEHKGDMVFYFFEENGFFGYILGDPNENALANNTDKCVNAELGTDGTYTVTASVKDKDADESYEYVGDAFDANVYEYAFVHLYHESEEGQAFNSFVTAGPGKDEQVLQLKEAPSIEIENGFTDFSGYVRLRYMDELESGKEYTLEYADYRGTVECESDGRYKLNLFCFDLPKYGYEIRKQNDDGTFVYDKEVIVNAFSSALEERKDLPIYEINVLFPENTTEISAELWNQMVDVLKTEYEDYRINIRVYGDLVEHEWYFWKPERLDETNLSPVNISSGMSVENEIVNLNYAQTEYAAESVSVNYKSYLYDPQYIDLLKLFGALQGKDGHSIVNKATGEIQTAMANHWFAEWDNGTEEVNLNIDRVNELTKGTTYEVLDYVGHIDEWNNEDGTVHRTLNIHYGVAGKSEPFSHDELRAILKHHEDYGLKYDEINLEQAETETNLVYADISERASALMKTDEAGRKGCLTWSFWDEYGRFEWRLDNPAAKPVVKDFGVDARRHINTLTNEKKFKIGAYAADGTPYEYISEVMSADNVTFNIITQNYYEEDGEIFEYPEGQLVYDFVVNHMDQMVLKEDPSIVVYGWNGESDACVGIDGLQKLQLNNWYTLEEGAYRGYIWGDTLELYAEDLGKDTFTDADIQAAAEYYKNVGYTFDFIKISQKNGSTNTIDKDIVNSLRGILNWEAVEKDPDHELSLAFFFDTHNQDLELAFCRLVNPGMATKDINATLTFTVNENQSVTVKAKKNTYNAKEVRMGVIAGENTDFAKSLVTSIGDAREDHNEEGLYDYLAVFKKGTEYVENVQGLYCKRYSGDEEMGMIYDFTIGSAQNLQGDVNYQFNAINCMEAPFKVGMDVKLLEQAWMSDRVKDAASTKHTFKCLTEDTASISTSGVITPMNEGDVLFTVSYVNNGQTYLEVYQGYAVLELQDIIISETEKEFDIPANGREKLELTLKADPYQHGIARDDIQWSIKAENSKTGEFDQDTDIVQALTWNEDDEEILGGDTDGWFAVYPTEEDIRIQITAGYEAWDFETEQPIWHYDSCIVTVRKPLEVPDVNAAHLAEYGRPLYALTNFDTVLGNVELPTGWKWSDDTIKLAPFAEMDGHHFKAIYTEDGRSQEVEVWVPLITITSIDVIGVVPVWNGEVNLEVIEVPANLEGGETLGMNVSVNMNGITCYCEDEECNKIHKANIFDEYLYAEDGRLELKWTVPKDCDVKLSHDKDAEGKEMWKTYAEDCCVFTADAKKAGVKKFTVSLIDKQQKNKVLFKSTASIKVTKKPIADIELIKALSDLRTEEGYGTLTIRQVEGSDFAATVTSSDASVARVKLVGTKKGVTYEYENVPYTVVETVYEYTELKPGFVDFTVKLKDEVNSSFVISHEVFDYDPKIVETAFELNKAFVGDKTPVTIQFPAEFMAINDSDFEISIDEKFSDSFDILYSVDDDAEYISTVYAELTAKDGAKAATHKNVPINITFRNDLRETAETFAAKINVKVISKAPSVTLKQTKNVNAFYSDDRGYGAISIDTKGLEFTLEMQENAELSLLATEDQNVFEICTTEETVKGNKKITFKYQITNDVGATYTASKVLTIKVEEKAPAIVMSQKSDTIYPVTGTWNSVLRLTDKATGKQISVDYAALDQGKKKEPLQFAWVGVDEYYGLESVKTSKNFFNIAVRGEELVFDMSDGNSAVNSTEKYILQIKEHDWNKPVSITYSIKVNTAKPKLKLGTTKLTLNKNKDIAGYQTAVTTLGINGYAGECIWAENVRITGADAASNLVLNKAISLEYRNGEGLVAKLHPEYGLDNLKGTYKFKIWVACGAYEANTILSVALTDKSAAGCLKLSKKGSIDVLARENSYLTYTVKASNISGTIKDVRLEGEDSIRFYAEMTGTANQFNIYARDGYDFSTKATYKVTPVIKLLNHDYEPYYVMAVEQAIKVTQGKPKVTITAPDGNVLYTQHGNTLKLDISAVLKNENVEIEDVELTNYTDVMDWHYENGELYLRVLKDSSYATVFKQGKSYALKFNVTYSNKAANEKPVSVTYKVTIK